MNLRAHAHVDAVADALVRSRRSPLTRTLTLSPTRSSVPLRSVVAMVALACGVGTAWAQSPGERTWPAELRLERTIGDADGVEFGLPVQLIARPGGGFVVSDRADGTVRAFDAQGVEAWTFGGQGSGPGEFRAFTDLEYDRTGELMVLDPDLQRITVLSDAGELIETMRTPGPVRRLLPAFIPGSRSVVPRDDEHLWTTITPSGAFGRSSLLPRGISFPHPIVGEASTARTQTGAVVAYRWSSRIVFLGRTGAIRSVQPGIDAIDFPGLWNGNPAIVRVDTAAVPATRDIAAGGGLVYVLSAGAQSESRVIDVYREDLMQYVGSIRVPSAVSDIAVLTDGRLATLEAELVPVVRIWSVHPPFGPLRTGSTPGPSPDRSVVAGSPAVR